MAKFGDILRIGLIASACAIALPARAAEPASCRAVRMSDPGWTDITSTNGVAGVVLDALGYRQHVDTLSVPITFRALQDGDIDVFLGNWMPAQQNSAGPLIKSGKVDLVRHNLERAKFTLAVPTYVAEAGVHGFGDLSRFADRFGKKIYGIDAGAPANQNIQRMLDAGDFGLRGWQLVDSSEQAMLAQVGQAVQAEAVGRVPRLGAASDEHQAADHLPGRRRPLFWRELWGHHGQHPGPQGIHGGVPEHRPLLRSAQLQHHAWRTS